MSTGAGSGYSRPIILVWEGLPLSFCVVYLSFMREGKKLHWKPAVNLLAAMKRGLVRALAANSGPIGRVVAILWFTGLTGLTGFPTVFWMVCYYPAFFGTTLISILEEIQAITNKLSESTPKLGTASPAGHKEVV